MSSPRHTPLHRLLGYSTVGLGVLAITIAAVGFLRTPTEGYIIRVAKPIPWKIFEVEEIERGVTVPADTHVVFHLPLTFERMHREILLGHKGKSTRYWGYCFPANYDPDTVDRRRGFPGQIFLSEAEREVMQQEQQAQERPRYSILRLPSKEDISVPDRSLGRIRHQIEFLKGGMLCYLMTAGPLALGLDRDGDKLNMTLERELQTNDQTPDTDADGIFDGTEYLTGTSPMLRDTDSDSIIDGIEDKNWNGKVDKGETDPRQRDTDHEGLCDGLCRIRLGNQQEVYAGEDKNLNGEIDEKETDPLLDDTDGDRSSDYIEFLNCIKSGSRDC